jgi:predicted ATPase/class 3 adenylate cyclase
MSELPTGTVTFLFTDLEASTRLWEEHPEAMKLALARHDEILRDAITAHQGHVVKSTGDGVHAVFASAHDALDAAVDAQRALGAESWPMVDPVRVRMGLHSGEGEHRDGDYFGTSTNRAARLMSVAHGGQVLVSLSTAELLSDDVRSGVTLVDLGEHRLRDLSRADRVFQVGAPGLAAEFPPIRSLDAFPGNLPVQLTSFVGRHDELVQLGGILRDARLVTITGTGGVGKTRVAVQLAAELLQRFPDGAWLCELAAAGDPETMVQVVASTLGASPRAGMSLASSVAEFLRTRRLLLVLDNCEHLLDATARLAEEILREASGVRILATSREGLAVGGERVVPLRSLALPDPAVAEVADLAAAEAVRLFVERAEASRSGFSLETQNAASVVDICRRLDGVPLAIELAAARIASMSAAEISARLDERFRLLTGGRRTAVERHHTLRATVDWSYSLLAPADQRVFDRLGVFAGSFDASAAESVVAGEGIETWDVVDALSTLVEKSMITAEEAADGTTRYELLETLRAYARERLDDAGLADDHRRAHAEYYAGLAEQAGRGLVGPDEFAWRRRLYADLANLRTAVTWALDAAGESETAVRIVAGLAPEALNDRAVGVGIWAEHARATAATSTPGRRSAVLAAASWQAFQLGDYQAARTLGQDAVDAAPTADCPVPSFAYVVSSAAESFDGHTERAKEVVDSAGQVPELAADQFGRVQLLTDIAIADAGRNAYSAACVSATEAVRLARDVGNPSSQAIALGVFGWVFLRDDPRAATAALEESIALTRAGAGDAVFPTALILVAPLRARAGDLEGALHALHAGLAHARDVADFPAASTALASAVEVAFTARETTVAAIFGGMLDSEAFRGLLYANDPYRPARERVLDRVSTELGTDQYASRVAEGMATTFDEGIEYALAEFDRIISSVAVQGERG